MENRFQTSLRRERHLESENNDVTSEDSLKFGKYSQQTIYCCKAYSVPHKNVFIALQIQNKTE